MVVEQSEKWQPVEPISTPAARALVKEDHKSLTVTLVFSEIVGGIDSDLEINFGRVPAYTVYEEFVHPWNVSNGESPPKLEGEWKDFSHPLLMVKNSVWLDSLSESLLFNYPNCVHYQLVTLDQTVDVICNTTPKVSWVAAVNEV